MSGDSDRHERRRSERAMSGEDEPRLERVVVGMDFEPSALEALRWTRAVFAPLAELVVVHVLDEGETEPPAEDAAPVGSTPEIVAAERRLSGILDVAGQPPERGVVRSGYPPTVVAAVAEESGADVIVVGTRGPGTPASSHLGSTAERLIRISPVPVLLTAAGAVPRPSRILVPVDESELTSPVLAWTALLAGLWDASVTLLHIVDPDAPAPVREDADDVDPVAEATVWLRRLAKELKRPGADSPGNTQRGEITTLVASGRPGDAVLAAAAELDSELIVMGRRGSGRIFSGLLGSTASSVLRGADCPVLVVVDPPFAIIDAW